MFKNISVLFNNISTKAKKKLTTEKSIVFFKNLRTKIMPVIVINKCLHVFHIQCSVDTGIDKLDYV